MKLLRNILPWLLLALAAACCFWLAARPGYVPALEIVGDVSESISARQLADLGAAQKVNVYGERCRAVSLDELARTVGAVSLERVILQAGDGFSAALSGDSMAACWLTFSAAKGWHALSDAHPISINGEELRRIVFVGGDNGRGLTVDDGSTVRSYTVGGLYAGVTVCYPYQEGAAEKEYEGEVYTSAVATYRDCIPLAELGLEGQALRLTNARGETMLAAADQGLFQLKGSSISYIEETSRLCWDEVVGIAYAQ